MTYDRRAVSLRPREDLQTYAEALLMNRFGRKFSRADVSKLTEALDKVISTSPAITRLLKSFEQGGGLDAVAEAKAMAAKLRFVAQRAKRDAGMIDNGDCLTETDVEDLLVIADMIQSGNREIAFSMGNKLDTIVRDSIPGDVWRYLGGQTF